VTTDSCSCRTSDFHRNIMRFLKPPCVRTFYFTPVVSSSLLSLLFFFLAYSQRSEIGCPPYFHTLCGLSADLECRSEMWCMRFSENTGCKNYAKNCHLHTITQLCRVFLHNWKKLVKQQYFLHMSSQYGEHGPLTAD